MDAFVRSVSLCVIASTIGSSSAASSAYPNTLTFRMSHLTPVPVLSTVCTSWSSAKMKITGEIISPWITPLHTLNLSESSYFPSTSHTLAIPVATLYIVRKIFEAFPRCVGFGQCPIQEFVGNGIKSCGVIYMWLRMICYCWSLGRRVVSIAISCLDILCGLESQPVTHWKKNHTLRQSYAVINTVVMILYVWLSRPITLYFV